MHPIPPTDLRDYLKSLGWSPREDAYQHRLYVLENPEHPKRQMVFPMDMTASDYLDSSDSVVAKISELLKRTPDSVRADAMSTKDDILRVRIAMNRDRAGVPLTFAGSLVAGTQRLLKSSACTVIRPRLHHPRLTLSDAVQLMDKCSLGHTEPGSFVVKVSCPVLAMDVQGQLDIGEHSRAPFVRQVTLTLFRGLTSLVQAIETDKLEQLVEDLKESSSPRLSSNLCEAVTQLQDETLDNSVDLSLHWSSLYPVPAHYRKASLRIQSDYFSRIEEVRRELQATEGDHEDTFVGTVERLDGEMSEAGTRSGEVILMLLTMEGESIKVRTTLDPEQYQKADRAHMTDGAYVKVRGQLRPGRQPRQLVNLKFFDLLDPSETHNG